MDVETGGNGILLTREEAIQLINNASSVRTI